MNILKDDSRMDDFAFHHHQFQYIYGPNGQDVYLEQAGPVPDLDIYRSVEIISDVGPASIELFNQSKLGNNNDCVPAQAISNNTPANEMKITSNKEVSEVNKPFRRFTIGMPVRQNGLIAFDDRSTNEPTVNLWRRTFEDAEKITNGFMDGSSWEQHLSIDNNRPFSSPSCLDTTQIETKFQNENLSSSSMKSFDDSERIRSMSKLTHTDDIAFFGHLTSTNITEDLHGCSPNLPSDLHHIQKRDSKRSFDYDTLVLDESKKVIQQSASTSAATPIKKAKKEKDPKKLADRRNKRRESHNAVERRRRGLINDRIAELAMLLPRNDLMDAIAQSANGGTVPHIDLKPFLSQRPDLLHERFLFDGLPIDDIAQSKPNKGIILTKAVEYIRYLQDLCTILRQNNERLQSESQSETQNN